MPTTEYSIEIIDHQVDAYIDGVIYRHHIDEVIADVYLEKEGNSYFLKDKQQRFSPITIDFTDPFYRHRGGVEYLPKAFKGLTEKAIIDATAGWARDAWLMAYRGFQVQLKERNPYLAFLLKHGIKKAQENTALSRVAQRLSIEAHDAMQDDFFTTQAIYIDPMYPDRKKSAKVKNPMQVLHTLLGGAENDSDALLMNMLKKTNNRVVVKRPKSAPYLAEIEPHRSIQAPNTRFDIYLPHQTL